MNVATFVLFRILLLGWMTRWLTVHRDDVPILFFTVGSLGLATIVGMNIVLFYRILVGDYIGPSRSNAKKFDEDVNNDESCKDGDGETTAMIDEQIVASNANNQQTSGVHQRHPITKDVNRIMRTLLDQPITQENDG